MWGDQGKLPSRVHFEGRCPWLSVQGRAGYYSSLNPRDPAVDKSIVGRDPMR